MSDKSIKVEPQWEGEKVETFGKGSSLWDFKQLEILKLWQEYGVRGEGVNAYVIDSGIASHPSFIHQKHLKALSFMDDTDSPVDGNGHGTWCCGKIGAMGVGLAPKCNLHSLRTLGDDGSGYTYYSTDALRWIASQKAPHIVNMSLGSFHHSHSQQEICRELYDRGCIILAAAGNENTRDLSYPAAYDGVLAVAAINKNKERAWFSNYGSHIAIAAPGVACYATYLDNGYRKLMGTSMASPTVAGLMTLGYSFLLKSKPKFTPQQIRDALIKALSETAHDLGEEGKDDMFGYGGINGSGFMKALADL